MIRKFLFAIALLLPTTAQAAWHEATSNHFVVYSQGSQQDARDFAAKLERFNFVLRTVRPIPADTPSIRLRVFLLQDQSAMARMAGGSVAGYYVPDARGLMLVGTRRRAAATADVRTARTDQSDLDPESVLFHEYTHHFTFQYFPASYPVWYSEGYAEFWGSTRILAGDVVEVGLPADHRFGTFRALGWMPLERLLSVHNYSEASGYNIFLLYAEGWLLVRYIFEHPNRQRQIQEYLRLVNQGVDYAEAARRAIPDMAAFNNELFEYAGANRFNVVRLPFRTIDVGPITVRTVGPAEDALMLDEIKLSQGYRQRDATEFAASVRGTANRFPNDPFAIRMVMETQFLAGNNAEAVAAADRLLAIDANHPRALMIRSLVQMAGLVAARSNDQAAWRAARQPLVRAVNAARQDPVVLREYYRSYLMQNIAPPDAAQNALYTAMELAPSDDELRYLLARDFERRDMIPEAIAIIRPVAYQVPDRSRDSESERRQREEREVRDRAAGQERHETAREMLVRLEARAGRPAAPAARPAG
jgi:tetratricopeptide (TPR) repeat protein